MRTLILALSLWLSGCTPPIYSQFCTEKTEKIACFQVADALTKKLLPAHFLVYLNDACPYVLQIQEVHALTCNNPQSIALGKDFDGYVRVQVFHKERCYWRAQQDFKTKGSAAALGRLLELLRSELIKVLAAPDESPHFVPNAPH